MYFLSTTTNAAVFNLLEKFLVAIIVVRMAPYNTVNRLKTNALYSDTHIIGK